MNGISIPIEYMCILVAEIDGKFWFWGACSIKRDYKNIYSGSVYLEFNTSFHNTYLHIIILPLDTFILASKKFHTFEFIR